MAAPRSMAPRWLPLINLCLVTTHVRSVAVIGTAFSPELDAVPFADAALADAALADALDDHKDGPLIQLIASNASLDFNSSTEATLVPVDAREARMLAVDAGEVGSGDAGAAENGFQDWRYSTSLLAALIVTSAAALQLYIVYAGSNLVEFDQLDDGTKTAALSLRPGCMLNVLSQVAFKLSKAVARDQTKKALRRHQILLMRRGLLNGRGLATSCLSTRCCRLISWLKSALDPV
jgi:hypothetical protein